MDKIPWYFDSDQRTESHPRYTFLTCMLCISNNWMQHFHTKYPHCKYQHLIIELIFQKIEMYKKCCYESIAKKGIFLVS